MVIFLSIALFKWLLSFLLNLWIKAVSVNNTGRISNREIVRFVSYLNHFLIVAKWGLSINRRENTLGLILRIQRASLFTLSVITDLLAWLLVRYLPHSWCGTLVPGFRYFLVHQAQLIDGRSNIWLSSKRLPWWLCHVYIIRYFHDSQSPLQSTLLFNILFLVFYARRRHLRKR